MFNWKDLKRGQKAYAWVWSGGEQHEILVGTVVRVNRKTVTIRWENETQDQRVEPHLLVGVVDWAE